jgi:hypothetical protein
MNPLTHWQALRWHQISGVYPGVDLACAIVSTNIQISPDTPLRLSGLEYGLAMNDVAHQRAKVNDKTIGKPNSDEFPGTIAGLIQCYTDN